MTLKHTLKELGLNDKEITIYLNLIKHGSVSPSELSNLTKINRATVYSSAKSLQGRGLITEDISKKAVRFIPVPPNQIAQIIQRDERELLKKKTLLNKAIEEIGLLTSEKTYPVPKIRFIEESNLENYIKENMPRWVESLRKFDSTWWGTQDHTFSEQFMDFTTWYWKQKYINGIHMNLITNNTEVERKLKDKYRKPERQVKFSNEVKITSSVWIAGDYIIMIVTNIRPHYLFEIHDATLAYNMREVFKKTWKDTIQTQ